MANLLHKCGHGISSADIRHLNKSWANEVAINTNQILSSTLSTGKLIHVAIDNSDAKQQTITGSKTTHYTNAVAFQLRTSNLTEIISTQNIEKTEYGVFSEDREGDYGQFKIKQKVCPNSLPNFIDSNSSDYLDYAFSKDILWVLVNAIGNKYVSSDKDSL